MRQALSIITASATAALVSFLTLAALISPKREADALYLPGTAFTDFLQGGLAFISKLTGQGAEALATTLAAALTATPTPVLGFPEQRRVKEILAALGI